MDPKESDFRQKAAICAVRDLQMSLSVLNYSDKKMWSNGGNSKKDQLKDKNIYLSFSFTNNIIFNDNLPHCSIRFNSSAIY